MTRIKSIIKCIISKPGYNGNKQLESRGLPGPSFEQRQELGWYGPWVGETRLPWWWIIICAMGTMPRLRLQCVHSTRYLIRSVADVCCKILIQSQSDFYSVRMERGGSFVFVYRPPPHYSRSKISPRCCLNVNLEIIPGMLTLSPLYPPPTPLPGAETPRLSALSGPRLSLSECLSCSVTLALWTSPRHSPHTQSWYSGQDNKNAIKYSQIECILK